MRIVTIDPGSKSAGVAMWHGTKLDSAFLATSSSKSRELRIVRIAADITKMLKWNPPDMVVIEVPSGFLHGGRRGREKGLTTYAFATGAIWWECRRLCDEVETVTEREWTGGVPKKRRAEMVRAKYPKYQPDKDKGLDVADAIGLGDWWWRRRIAG